MKKTWLLFLAVLSFSAPFVYGMDYTVQKNDSLWSISKTYSLSLADIKKLNELISEDIYEGQRLYLPQTITDYTVQPGDHLSGLAVRFRTQLKYIIILNNLANEDLNIGQNLRIPQDIVESVQKQMMIHTVQPGDNLSQLALKYQVSTQDILEWNNKSNDTLYSGEKLKIYSDKKPETLSPTPPIQTNTQDLNKIVHIVQAGEYLGSIAQTYNVSIDDIRKWNEKSGDDILIGEKLVLHVSGTYKPVVSTPQEKPYYHTVQAGEHLTGLAQLYGTTVKSIKEWNKLDRDILLKGERLVIKNYSPKETKPEVKPDKKVKWSYAVKSGDNLQSLAKRFDVNVDDIKKWNNKKNDVLYIGEKLALFTDRSDIPTKDKNIITAVKYQHSVSWKDIKLYPVAKSRISYLSRTEKGLILHLSSRTSVKAISDGMVEYAGFLKTKNFVVILNLGENKRVVYGYMSDVSVQAGDKITAGKDLGTVDYLSIHDTSPLLLELYEGTEPVDIYEIYPYFRQIRFTAFK